MFTNVPVNAESCIKMKSLENTGRDECRRSLFEHNPHLAHLDDQYNAHLPGQLDTDLKTGNTTVGSSWKLCTLKCGLTIISSLCLFAYLVYNVVSNIIDKVEFWDSLNKYQEIKNYNTVSNLENTLLKNISATIQKILEEVLKIKLATSN